MAGGINVGNRNTTVSLAATLVDRRESSRRYMKFEFGSFLVFTRLRLRKKVEHVSRVNV